MGLVANLNVLALMIMPIVVLCKGHRIVFSNMAMLLPLVSGAVFCRLMLLPALDLPPLTMALRALLVPILTEIGIVSFVLNNKKAQRAVGLSRCLTPTDGLPDGNTDGDEVQGSGTSAVEREEAMEKKRMTAAVAVMFATMHVILSTWAPWYRDMSSAGSEPRHLIAALGTFLLLVTVTLEGRLLWRAPSSRLMMVAAVHAAAYIAAGLIICPLITSWVSSPAILQGVPLAHSAASEEEAWQLWEVVLDASYRVVLAVALVATAAMLPPTTEVTAASPKKTE